MLEKEWQIAIFGTFDVENYGDLLFPIIAEAELTKRLGSIKLHRFSYHAKSPPQWPYTVTSLVDLPAIADKLDGVLIGGGFIIRFDKEVAAGYYPPTSDIHHPTGYWLTPALIALQHGIPLIWNAPGMHCNEIPAWGLPLLKLTLEYSHHVRVRDLPTQRTLSQLANKAKISVLPDTAFGISQVIDDAHPSTEFQQLRKFSGLSGRYIVIHAIRGLDIFLRFIKTHSALLSEYHFLILPIGPVLGDHESIVGNDLPNAIQLSFWPTPKVLAELIGHAEAVIGHSFHLAITALAYGVPVFSSADLNAGKYTALAAFEGLFAMPTDAEIEPHWFISRLGKKSPCSAATEALQELNTHWDEIAAIVREGSSETQPALNAFWQNLPNLLEAESERVKILEVEQANKVEFIKKMDAELDAKNRSIEELSTRLAAANTHISTLYNSYSIKVTAPLRFLTRTFRNLIR